MEGKRVVCCRFDVSFKWHVARDTPRQEPTKTTLTVQGARAAASYFKDGFVRPFFKSLDVKSVELCFFQAQVAWLVGLSHPLADEFQSDDFAVDDCLPVRGPWPSRSDSTR